MYLRKLIIGFNISSKFSRRVSTTTNNKSAYGSDGKTTVTVLNKESGFGVMIDTYSKQGFRLNNGLYVIGPMVLFPHTVLSWKVADDQDINRKSLALFGLIEPKLDLLVIGYGKKSTATRELHQEVLSLKSKIKINIEILPVEKAAATFNYLSSERRWVAGAFIPPEVVHVLESEFLAERAKKKEVYEIDDYL